MIFLKLLLLWEVTVSNTKKHFWLNINTKCGAIQVSVLEELPYEIFTIFSHFVQVLVKAHDKWNILFIIGSWNNLGQKELQEVSSPNSCWKSGQLQVQTRLLRAISRWG